MTFPLCHPLSGSAPRHGPSAATLPNVRMVHLGPGDAAAVSAAHHMFDCPPSQAWTEDFLSRPGRGLVTAPMATAKTAGCSGMWVPVEQGNEAATALYLATGAMNPSLAPPSGGA